MNKFYKVKGGLLNGDINKLNNSILGGDIPR